MSLDLRYERNDDGIVTVWLDQPGRPVVIVDMWLLDQLNLLMDELERTPPRGLILMSASRKAFVAGADLGEIAQLPDDQLMAYLTEGAEVFNRIATLPCPTVAAVDGAALGGGLELALHCDAIVAASPAPGEKAYRVGLVEAGLGLCPGWGGTQMLPARIDPAQAIEMIALGEARPLSEFPAGLVARTVDNIVDLHETAMKWIEDHPKTTARRTPVCIDEVNADDVAAGLAAVAKHLADTPATHAVVEAVQIGIEEGWAAGTAAERRLLVSLRHTDEAKQRIEAFFARNA